MEPVDGNAIAGLLLEVFGVEMTTATERVRALRRRQGAGRAGRLQPGAGHGRPLPHLHRPC